MNEQVCTDSWAHGARKEENALQKGEAPQVASDEACCNEKKEIHICCAPDASSGLRRGVECVCGRVYVEQKKGRQLWLKPEQFLKRKQYQKEKLDRWRKANAEKVRATRAAWVARNKEKVAQYKRAAYRRHSEKIKKRIAEWKKRNPGCHEKLRITWRNYWRRNRDRINKYQSERVKKLRLGPLGDAYREKRRQSRKRLFENNPQARIANAMRARVKVAIVGSVKSDTTENLLGCSFEFARMWIESKWNPGMSWENYGTKGWHIDHIKPCASFDLTDPKQQALCFHFLNLQPLWAIENLKKSDKHETMLN